MKRKGQYQPLGTRMRDFGRRVMRQYSASQSVSEPAARVPPAWKAASETPLVWPDEPLDQVDNLPLEETSTVDAVPQDLQNEPRPVPLQSAPVPTTAIQRTPAAPPPKPAPKSESRIDPRLIQILEGYEKIQAERSQVREQKKEKLRSEEVQRKVDDVEAPIRRRRASFDYVDTAVLNKDGEPTQNVASKTQAPSETSQTPATPQDSDDDDDSTNLSESSSELVDLVQPAADIQAAPVVQDETIVANDENETPDTGVVSQTGLPMATPSQELPSAEVQRSPAASTIVEPENLDTGLAEEQTLFPTENADFDDESQLLQDADLDMQSPETSVTTTEITPSSTEVINSPNSATASEVVQRQQVPTTSVPTATPSASDSPEAATLRPIDESDDESRPADSGTIAKVASNLEQPSTLNIRPGEIIQPQREEAASPEGLGAFQVPQSPEQTQDEYVSPAQSTAAEAPSVHALQRTPGDEELASDPTTTRSLSSESSLPPVPAQVQRVTQPDSGEEPSPSPMQDELIPANMAPAAESVQRTVADDPVQVTATSEVAAENADLPPSLPDTRDAGSDLQQNTNQNAPADVQRTTLSLPDRDFVADGPSTVAIPLEADVPSELPTQDDSSIENLSDTLSVVNPVVENTQSTAELVQRTPVDVQDSVAKQQSEVADLNPGALPVSQRVQRAVGSFDESPPTGEVAPDEEVLEFAPDTAADYPEGLSSPEASQAAQDLTGTFDSEISEDVNSGVVQRTSVNPVETNPVAAETPTAAPPTETLESSTPIQQPTFDLAEGEPVSDELSLAPTSQEQERPVSERIQRTSLDRPNAVPETPSAIAENKPPSSQPTRATDAIQRSPVSPTPSHLDTNPASSLDNELVEDVFAAAEVSGQTVTSDLDAVPADVWQDTVPEPDLGTPNYARPVTAKAASEVVQRSVEVPADVEISDARRTQDAIPSESAWVAEDEDLPFSATPLPTSPEGSPPPDEQLQRSPTNEVDNDVVQRKPEAISTPNETAQDLGTYLPLDTDASVASADESAFQETAHTVVPDAISAVDEQLQRSPATEATADVGVAQDAVEASSIANQIPDASEPFMTERVQDSVAEDPIMPSAAPDLVLPDDDIVNAVVSQAPPTSPQSDLAQDVDDFQQPNGNALAQVEPPEIVADLSPTNQSIQRTAAVESAQVESPDEVVPLSAEDPIAAASDVEYEQPLNRVSSTIQRSAEPDEPLAQEQPLPYEAEAGAPPDIVTTFDSTLDEEEFISGEGGSVDLMNASEAPSSPAPSQSLAPLADAAPVQAEQIQRTMADVSDAPADASYRVQAQLPPEVEVSSLYDSSSEITTDAPADVTPVQAEQIQRTVDAASLAGDPSVADTTSDFAALGMEAQPVDLFEALRGAGVIDDIGEPETPSSGQIPTPYIARTPDEQGSQSDQAKLAGLIQFLESVPNPPPSQQAASTETISRAYDAEAKGTQPSVQVFADSIMRAPEDNPQESENEADVDVNQLARDVYALLRQRLRIERERRSKL